MVGSVGKRGEEPVSLAGAQGGVDSLALEYLFQGLGRLRDGVFGEERLNVGH